jgi:ABC-type polysaccharide/polyol phosphate transport system ATPase subunit
MENSSAVSVQNVSKKFRLFGSSKDRFWEALHPFKKQYHREFWALKDISFEVPKGTTLGIVGRNGSGKSTLLQIICSVLRPTSGVVEVNGRISALLELGAGFNPEFTGRDNVLLNGALMSFSRKEMEERLPLIENFADIGEFIDQPVKIYSSGMFVRLAFAAAINVDPDILIVDEALAVGDAKFQHKCYQKFLEFQKAGKTIIFVTHSTDAIVRHCGCAVLLERGEIVEIGEPKSITNYYIDLLFTGQVSGYANFPTLAEEGYQGFNIVHYGMKYYAFLQSLGHIDLTRPFEKELKEFVAEKKCFIGASLEEVKQLVNQIISPYYNDPIIQNMGIHPIKKENTKLEKFLEEIPEGDNCVSRKSYNKNEYRYGDKRAGILDYFIVSERGCDIIDIRSGETIDIYVKIKYYDDIAFPMTGFALKSVDGILVSGANTMMKKIKLSPIPKHSLCIFKWRVKINIVPGDYFIDFGCGEYSSGVSVPLDRRYGLAYVSIQSNNEPCGLVYLDTEFNEYLRRPLEENKIVDISGLSKIRNKLF